MAFVAACLPSAATASVVPSPNQTPNENVLFGVDGVAQNDVWASGFALAEARTSPRSMLMRWNGSAWSLVDHPRRPGTSVLNDVDAIAGNDVWAVGSSAPGTGEPGSTLIQHWNGSAWSIVPSPSGAGSGVLNSVEAASANDVWAVGSQNPTTGFATTPLVTRWNGQQWRLVPTPTSLAGFALNAVDATSSTNAWAVGTKIASPIVGGYSATTMRWNGSAWQEVPVPNNGNMTLNGIAVAGPNDVWAVGSRLGAPNWVPVTLHWNGSVWSQVDNPVRTPQGGELADVVAVSSSQVYAAGSAISNGVQRTLLLQWNGSAWTEVPTPTGSREPILRGVGAIDARTAWAVGAHRLGPIANPGPQRTLTIRVTS
jgi:hypothetical protein